jgi:SLOG cluster2
MAAQPGKGAEGGPVFIYPDPLLSQEETEELAALGATFKTPISIWSRRLTGLRLGLSVSPGDKAEETALGLSPMHLEDATKVIARQALAAGATLVYGGALNVNTPETRNLTVALHEMIGAYNRASRNAEFAPLINYTPWPWHQDVEVPWLAERRETLKVIPCDAPAGIAAAYGAGDGPGHVERLAATARGRYALARSLTSMRERLTRETHARVVLGGKPAGFMGLLPGVIEEALMAIRARRPLYVVGGFGGAGRIIAQALQGERSAMLSIETQVHLSPPYGEMLAVYHQARAGDPSLPAVDYDAIIDELAGFGTAGLAATNGLTADENLELFRVASVDAALYLIMKGLANLPR